MHLTLPVFRQLSFDLKAETSKKLVDVFARLASISSEFRSRSNKLPSLSNERQ